MSEETIIYRPERGRPRLTIISGDDVREYDLKEEQMLGRPAKGKIPDIPVSSGVVSRQHGRFRTDESGCRYCDAGSLNGTICDGAMLSEGSERILSDGDVLRIHGKQDVSCDMDVLMLFSTVPFVRREWTRLKLDEAEEVAIGRNEKLRLLEKSVSRRHASLFRAKKGWALIDHGSKNGVYLNGIRICEPVYLKKNDVIRIAGYYFVFRGDDLLFQVDPHKSAEPIERRKSDPVERRKPVTAQKLQEMRVQNAPEKDAADALDNRSTYRDFTDVPEKHTSGAGLSIWIEERNVWQRAKKKTLLRDIRMDISPGSLVLILGGSGAGKTTFMNAVMGYERAEGQILYSGTDIYREYERMKYEIGYVPQQDLLRMNDTVYDTLQNAAKMKLPIMDDAGYDAHVEETLHLLGLENQRASLVGKLSGGQRKRLSIGVEHVGNPALFFLDEPDSGLDGMMARRLMENLRTIADEGRIVLVISHGPNRAADLFDRIIVLAKDKKEEGRLVFYGTPENALSFFGVDTLEEIVGRINGPEEGGEGLADLYIERFEDISHRAQSGV